MVRYAVLHSDAKPRRYSVIGPPTPLERIRALEGRLADVAMQAQQLHLQYGNARRGEMIPWSEVSHDFRVLRDWMRQDSAAREKPPMFRTRADVIGPQRPPSRQQRRRQQLLASKRNGG